MSRVKYQHYVPRFYLEGFQGESGKLWCYDKHLDKVYQQSALRLGGETLFYDVPDADKITGVSQFLEKFFHPLESDTAGTLRSWRLRLQTVGDFSPSRSEMLTMAFFIAVQHLRTPRARRQAVDLAVLSAKVSFFNYVGRNNPELARTLENPLEDLHFEIPKKHWASIHAQRLLDRTLIEDLAAILLGHIWLVAENKTRWTYYTSDHPVVRIPHAKHPVRTMAGLRSPGIQIVLPLTPQYNLYLLERQFWRRYQPYHGRVLKLAIKQHVEFDNSAQVIHSSRFIYCQENDFDLARDMCREEPELKNHDRPGIVSKRGTEIKIDPSFLPPGKQPDCDENK